MNNYLAILPYVLCILAILSCIYGDYKSAFWLFVAGLFILFCFMGYVWHILHKNNIKYCLKSILKLSLLNFPNSIDKDSIKTLQKEQGSNPFKDIPYQAYSYDDKDIFPRIYITTQYSYLHFNIVINEMAVLETIRRHFDVSNNDAFECEKFIYLAMRVERDSNAYSELLEIFGINLAKTFIKDGRVVCLEISKKIWRQDYYGIYFNIRSNDNVFLRDIKQLDIIPSYPWYKDSSCVPRDFIGRNATLRWSYGDFEAFLNRHISHQKAILESLNAPAVWKSLILNDTRFKKFLSKTLYDDYGILH